MSAGPDRAGAKIEEVESRAGLGNLADILELYTVSSYGFAYVFNFFLIVFVHPEKFCAEILGVNG